MKFGPFSKAYSKRLSDLRKSLVDDIGAPAGPSAREMILSGQAPVRSGDSIKILGKEIETKSAPMSEKAGSARQRIVGPRLTPEELAARPRFAPKESYRPEVLQQASLRRPAGIGSLLSYARSPMLAPSAQTEAPKLAIAGTQVVGAQGMKQGGLASVAQDLASKGRYGDTMVAHISPEEAGILKALGGAGTINPKTGLPEFFKVFGIDLNPKKGIKLNLGPLGNVKVGRKSSDLLLAAGTGYAGATGFMGLNPATAAIGYGTFRTLASGNLQEGIMAGLSAYGMGQGFQSAGVGAPAAGAPTAPGGDLSGGSAGVQSGTVPVGGEYVPPDAVEAAYGPLTPPPTVPPGRELITTPQQLTAASQAAEATRAGFPLSDPQLGGISDLSAPFEVQPVAAENATAAAKQGFLGRNLPESVQKYVPDAVLNASGTTLAAGTLLGTSLIGGAQERAAFAAQQAAAQREEEEKRRRYEELFSRTLGSVPAAREGGLMRLAKGGMTYMEAGGTTGPTGVPRDVTGTGDGMSDSVPATIEGVQEARLADGEFVIPADVVADIGNGSSNAGSKKLYDMMDRIRKARHGTTKQPPEIDAERIMPA